MNSIVIEFHLGSGMEINKIHAKSNLFEIQFHQVDSMSLYLVFTEDL